MDRPAASRRNFALFGLSTLAGLLSTRQIDAAPYTGFAPERYARSGASLRTKVPTDTSASTEMVVDVRDFGARGDGLSDDAPSINAAIQAVRERHRQAGPFGLGCLIRFPAGVYIVNSTIDLTNLKTINTVIDGGASAILGRCAGRPVIDALGSRWLTMRDLTVLGDGNAAPTIGIQIGVLSKDVVADDHLFQNTKILGSYSMTCLYNRAAETCGFDHVFLWNSHPQSFCLIQDGLNHFDVKSSFAQGDLPRETDLSFNENEFINCDFRHSAAGGTVWLGDTARHAFIRCYAATDGTSSFSIYCGPNGHTMLDVDCHCETSNLQDVFVFTGPSENLYIHGFSYKDHECFAKRSVLNCAPHVRHIVLENTAIEVAGFAQPDCQLIDDPAKWALSGRYYSTGPGSWNKATSFNGSLSIGSSVRFIGELDGNVPCGLTSQRPGGPNRPREGALFFDRNLRKLLIWSGADWLDAMGSKV